MGDPSTCILIFLTIRTGISWLNAYDIISNRNRLTAVLEPPQRREGAVISWRRDG
jgi:hypothetical protein